VCRFEPFLKKLNKFKVPKIYSKYQYIVSHCFSNYDTFFLILFLCPDATLKVRLVGGHSRCAGRVEVLHRGQWGTVCDFFWDLADAAVVCRELDCGEPLDALGDAHFGPGSGPIWTNRRLCSGSESTLKNCGTVHWGFYPCDHTKDAGVICSGKLLQNLQ